MTDKPFRRRPVLRMLRGWRLRHQHPVNFGIHLLAIPLSVAGLVLLFMMPWRWGVALFILGYLLQYLGHRVEGNDLGEWAGIKRLIGRSYVGVAPQYCNQVSFTEEIDDVFPDEVAVAVGPQANTGGSLA